MKQKTKECAKFLVQKVRKKEILGFAAYQRVFETVFK